jgi:hypothetical protein
MPRLATLQLIGPVFLLVAVAGAEATQVALTFAPGSPALWYVHLAVFGPFRQGDDILGVYVEMAHAQLCLIALPVFLVACGGFHFKLLLPLAIASNLSLVYASFLLCVWHAHEPARIASLAGFGDVTGPDLYLRASLLGCALLSFAASHIIYIRDIRSERGPTTNP